VQRVRLGHRDVQLSRIVLGCMAFAPRSAAETARVVHAAFERGITSFDTAPLYGFGDSETALGQAVADRRDRVQILSKVGLRWNDSHGQPLFEFVDASGVRRIVRKDGRPHTLRDEVERSLRRLGVETIDLLQLHHPDRLTPLDDTLEGLRVLQRSGAVRAIGLSNVTAGELRLAVAGRHPPVVSVQQEYSLLHRDVEDDLLPTATAAGVGLLAYSPLARGVLAGRQLGNRPLPEDWRKTTSYFHRSTLSQVNSALEKLARPIARAHQATLAQLALAWVLSRPGVAAVIAGAGTPDAAIENAGAAMLSTTLSHPELQQLGAAFARIDTSGAASPLDLARRMFGRLRGR
jgi:aryl-alcohol dehydrogenase-like predicted oxidoreductase